MTAPLRVRGLVKHFGPAEDPIRAVDGVSFDVQASEMVALYGPSGSGKTTLLRLIATHLRPDVGEVLIGGREVGRLRRRELDALRLVTIGFVPQSGAGVIAGLDAIDVAALKLLCAGVRTREAHRRVMPLLEELEVAGRARQRAHRLSLGERQRVLIAQALSTEPAIVLADEPTGALDTARTDLVLRHFRAAAARRGAAIVVVTHDLAVARHADVKMTLVDGRLTPVMPAASDPEISLA